MVAKNLTVILEYGGSKLKNNYLLMNAILLLLQKVSSKIN